MARRDFAARLADSGAGATERAAGGWRSQRPLGNSRPYRYLDVMSSRGPRDLVKDR
jgi:hypothetical protein